MHNEIVRPLCRLCDFFNKYIIEAEEGAKEREESQEGVREGEEAKRVPQREMEPKREDVGVRGGCSQNCWRES